MSHVPVRSDGTVIKRKLNAIRPVPSIAPPVDPFFDDVLLLLPLTGTGQTVVDYGPLAASTVIAFDGAAPVYTYEQNGNYPLFGQNTLYQDRPAIQFGRTLQAINSVNTLSNAKALCIELWFNTVALQDYDLFYAAEFAQQSAPGVFAGPRAQMYQTLDFIYEAYWLGNGFTPLTTPLGLGGWNYMALQKLAASSTTYCSLNGALIGTINITLSALNGWRFRLPNFGAAFAGTFGTAAAGEIRMTAADRYGSSAAPVPTAPWPLSGP